MMILKGNRFKAEPHGSESIQHSFCMMIWACQLCMSGFWLGSYMVVSLVKNTLALF